MTTNLMKIHVYLFVVIQEPTAPTPTLVIKGQPFETPELYVQMDGTVICMPASVSKGCAATFAAYYIYGVEYPRNGKNLLLFYQQQFAELDTNKALPAKVQRFINNMYK